MAFYSSRNNFDTSVSTRLPSGLPRFPTSSRLTLIASIFGLTMWWLVGVQQAFAEHKSGNGKPQKYNLIAIVTDDQARWSVGAYGNTEVRTPNMDRLAHEGVRFTNAFVTTPVCSPSRVSLLAGLYGTQVGITDWISPEEAHQGIGLPQSVMTWPEVLQKKGYRTALLGKWHLGEQPQFHPTHHGFDYFYGFLGGGHQPMNPVIEVNGKPQQMKGPLVDLVTDEALRFVKTNRDRPFAMLIHYNAPHKPYGPVTEADSAPFKTLFPVIPSAAGLNVVQVQQLLREYYASVHSIDRNLGRLLDVLEVEKLSNETIVLLTSDHGYNIGNHGIHGKGNGTWIAGGVDGPIRPNMFDTSIAIPLIIRQPGVIASGGQIEKLVSNLDMFPSVLGMLGIRGVEGVPRGTRDFSALLRGQEPTNWRDAVFGQYDLHIGGLAHMRMIRTDRVKLVRYFFASRLDELYDLKNDPDEANNLYQSPQYRETRDALEQRLTAWMTSINDPILQRNR